MNKQILLFFEYFEEEHLCKDVFLVPMYLGRLLGKDVTIIYPLTENNKSLPSIYRGVNLKPFPIYNSNYLLIKYWYFIKYIIINAKKIELLIRFFHCRLTLISCLLYKLFNFSGHVYVKLDVNPDNILMKNDHKSCFYLMRDKLASIFTDLFKKNVDVVTCESTTAYDRLQTSDIKWNKWGDKLVYMPNGFDSELSVSLEIKERLFSEKDNLIITVGRLGDISKNTEMFLKALIKLRFSDWKVVLIGPINQSLKEFLDSYFAENPDLNHSVIFTGPIYDKKDLWDYYSRAKVFVLTSRWESSGLVLYEAKRFRNYIISTDVGAAYDVIEGSRYGKIINQNDVIQLASELQLIIDNKNNLCDIYDNFDETELSWTYLLMRVVTKIYNHP